MTATTTTTLLQSTPHYTTIDYTTANNTTAHIVDMHAYRHAMAGNAHAHKHIMLTYSYTIVLSRPKEKSVGTTLELLR